MKQNPIIIMLLTNVNSDFIVIDVILKQAAIEGLNDILSSSTVWFDIYMHIYIHIILVISSSSMSF
jgi:hypothetical protein